MSFIAQLSGKECLVVGAGVTGQAVAKVLISYGAQVVFLMRRLESLNLKLSPRLIRCQQNLIW